MVVGHARAVADLCGIHACGRVCVQQLCRDAHQLRHLCRHTVREIPAVRAWVGHELLLVQRLQIVQRLLRRKAQLAVGLALERGQVVERRRLFAPLPALNLNNMSLVALACKRFGFIALFEPLAGQQNTAAAQRDGVESLGLKIFNFPRPLHQHGERRRHHAAHVQRAVVHERQQPRGVHAHEPVRLCAAQRGGIEPVIVPARAHILIRAAYLARLHGAEPQALHRLFAATFLVDQTEN